MPTLFVRNKGQVEGEVLFHSIHPFGIAITGDGRLLFGGIALSFGGKPKEVLADLKTPTTFSYFVGDKSLSALTTYRRIILREVYPNIDAVLTAERGGQFELQFLIEPGGNPEDVKLKVEGGDPVVREGDLYILRNGTEVLKVSDLKAYQGADEVPVRVRIEGNALQFEVEDYDPSTTLVIDPIFTLTLGSVGWDEGRALALDSSGNILVAGSVGDHTTFVSPIDTFGFLYNGEVFVSKFSPDLSTLMATAVVGGGGNDYLLGLAVSPSGDILITGYTNNSNSFAPDRVVFGDTVGFGYDVFVTKLSADLSQHLGTAILASLDDEKPAGLLFDSVGNVIVGGWTLDASSFVPYDTVFGVLGYYDIFVTKLDSTLSEVIANVMVGSSDRDRPFAMAVGEDGSVYITGETDDYTSFADERVVFGTPGWLDVFITRLSSDLRTHLGTAIVAGSLTDEAHALTVRGDRVLIAGWTEESDSFSEDRNVIGDVGSIDVFITELTADLSTHVATTILASVGEDKAHAVAVRPNGEVVVAGWTFGPSSFSTDREIIGDTGLSEAFLTVLDSTLSIHVGTVILASDTLDGAEAVLPLGGRSVLVAGWTGRATSFATADTSLGTSADMDAFVVLLTVPLGVAEREAQTTSPAVEVVGNTLRITLPHPSYVGYNVYLPDGRLLKRVSLGYLPAGGYEYPMDFPEGTYLLKVRIGDGVKMLKVVM